MFRSDVVSGLSENTLYHAVLQDVTAMLCAFTILQGAQLGYQGPYGCLDLFGSSQQGGEHVYSVISTLCCWWL